MKIFKFILYSSGFFIGLTIAFCANTNYDDRTYIYPATEASPPNEMTKEKQASMTPLLSLGKKLFLSNCASCHNKNMVDNLVGPALYGTLDRWKGREELLYEWIKNSAKVIASGDTYAVALFNKYNKSVMPAFQNLPDEDIEAILEYIDRVD